MSKLEISTGTLLLILFACSRLNMSFQNAFIRTSPVASTRFAQKYPLKSPSLENTAAPFVMDLMQTYTFFAASTRTLLGLNVTEESYIEASGLV